MNFQTMLAGALSCVFLRTGLSAHTRARTAATHRRSMRWTGVGGVVVCSLALWVAACGPTYPEPPRACDPSGLTARGCLSDEVCIDFKCVPRPTCQSDDDCDDLAYQCVLPAQVCQLRPGFGKECREPETPCALGEFCALGVCRTIADAAPCAKHTDCAVGQKCDPVHALCIPDGDCRLADDLPELACDTSERCDVLTGQCALQCQNECTRDTEAEDCGPGQRCDGACRCVQCLTDADCGPGLECNTRAGRCQSVNLCFSDDDCESPLVCEDATQLCQVPPPPCRDDFDCLLGSTCDVASGACVQLNGPCPSDRFEDADTPARAEVFDLAIGEVRLEEELSLCPNDDDVYAVPLNAGDVLVATVSNTAPAARASVFLLDETGETSLRFVEAPSRGNGRITYVAPAEQTVFLRVTSILAQTPYDLTIERLSGEPCAPDVNDRMADNGEPASPTDVERTDTQGVTLEGTICALDEDHYRIDLLAGEALTATLAFEGTDTDLDLAFLGVAGNVIAQSSGVGAPERLRRRFPVGTSVIVRVRGFGGRDGPYTLALAIDPPFVCTEDGAEPDDFVTGAAHLDVGEELVDVARTLCQNDLDVVTATLEDFEALVVQTFVDEADGDILIDIVDVASGTVLATSPPSAGGAAVVYNARAEIGGTETVAIRMRGEGGAIVPYTLRVTRESQLSCGPDDAEPNDTVGTAVPVPAAAALLSVCESDQDYFFIDGGAGKRLVAEARFRQAEGDLDLMLIGLDGEQILAVSDGVSDVERLEAVLPLDGTYTLRVFSLTSGARGRYSLQVSQNSP